jgi:quercetin dioxygenase-like cupin family protein
LKALRLPIDFSPAGLAADLGQVADADWVPHFNKSYFEGEWSGVSLRSTSGKADQLYPDPAVSEYRDTELLARTPYFREVLNAFECPLLAVRLLRLEAGSRIREHRDYNLSIEDGEFRVHVPVQTNPDLLFVLGGERVTMPAGTAWYLNVNHPHSVDNAGSCARVHLVLDCAVNEWALDLIAGAKADLFFQRIGDAGDLLRPIENAGEFASAVAAREEARELGFTSDEVRRAMACRRREWSIRTL